MNETPKPKATVDDIVQELRWLNENFVRLHADLRMRDQLDRQHEQAVRKNLSGVNVTKICFAMLGLLVIGAAINSTRDYGNLAELMQANIHASKVIAWTVLVCFVAKSFATSMSFEPIPRYPDTRPTVSRTAGRWFTRATKKKAD
jgi:hypothetical protein